MTPSSLQITRKNLVSCLAAIVASIGLMACQANQPDGFRSQRGSQGAQDSILNEGQGADDNEESDKDISDGNSHSGAENSGSTFISAEDQSQSVFGLTDFFNGRTGVASYLGTFNGFGLYMTSRQIANQADSVCSQFALALTESGSADFIGCKVGPLALDEFDVSFFLAAPPAQSQRGVQFAQSLPADGDRLQVLTFNHEGQRAAYQGRSDCRLLDNSIKIKRDPDLQFPTGASWSLPISCEGTYGDAGALVFDRSAKVIGVLWTGEPSTESAIGQMTESEIGQTTAESSIVELAEASSGQTKKAPITYMVPITAVIEELKKLAVEPVGSELSPLTEAIAAYLESI